MSGRTTEPAGTPFGSDRPPRPYPGLRPFEKHEWLIFFGRERMVDAVVNRLIHNRFVVVHGDSGCGKSSLIRAGVLPWLEQDSARGGAVWHVGIMLPGHAPLWNLAKVLAATPDTPNSGDDFEERVVAIRRMLNFGAGAVADLAEFLGADADRPFCLLVDQFEELFEHTRRHGDEQARLLADLLVGLAQNPPAGFYTVLTMRSEFLGACARYRGLAETVNANQYLLPRMEHADLLRAIREPAKLYSGWVSRELANRLIADSGGDQDQLPLIQHGLMRLHQRFVSTDRPAPADPQPELDGAESTSPRWRLESEHYQGKHGLNGLLSDHADEVMAVAQETCIRGGDSPRLIEDLFRALTEINADGHAIRRPCSLSELLAVTGATEGKLRCVLEAFRKDGVSFLRPYGEAPLEAQDRIDISHEALIRCWQRIADPEKGWLIREFRSGLIWRALLVQADSFERDRANLLGPGTTEERAAWLERRNPAWAQRYGGGWERVQKLLAASMRESKRIQAVERSRRRLQNVTAALIILPVIMGLLGWGWWQQSQVQQASSEAEGFQRELARERLWQGEPGTRPYTSPGHEERILLPRDTASDQANALEIPAQAAEDFPLRVFVHIAEDAQRVPAQGLERQLEERGLKDGSRIQAPGIELVNAAPRRSELRCFRAEECGNEGDQLLAITNEILAEPQLRLNDLSRRYGDSTAIRPRHFEIWFAAGDAIQLRSK